jgi:hypothetical protein
MGPLRWHQIVELLRLRGSAAVVRAPKRRIEHPWYGGLRPWYGEPVGQQSDWALGLGGGEELHIREFRTYYEAYLVWVAEPPANPRSGAAQALGGAALGAAAGWILGNSREAAAVGAALGGLLGLAVPTDDDDRS